MQLPECYTLSRQWDYEVSAKFNDFNVFLTRLREMNYNINGSNLIQLEQIMQQCKILSDQALKNIKSEKIKKEETPPNQPLHQEDTFEKDN